MTTASTLTWTVRTSATRTVLLAGALLLSAALSACGGDDAGSAGGDEPDAVATASAEEDAYFVALQTKLEESRLESEALREFRAGVFDASRPVEERMSGSVEYGERYRAYAEQRRDAVTALVPPESLLAGHTALLGAAEAAVTLGEELAERLAAQPLANEEAFANLFFELDGVTIEQRIRDACQDLQAYASAAGLAYDLGCHL